jgi:hypothetical protein
MSTVEIAARSAVTIESCLSKGKISIDGRRSLRLKRSTGRDHSCEKTKFRTSTAIEAFTRIALKRVDVKIKGLK